MKLSCFILLLAITFMGNARANPVFNDSLLTGTWKGTSICQVKNSPCHDEIAVYHVSKGNAPDTYQFVMNKMVNGVEEEMGITQYKYDPSAHTFTSIDENHKTIWKFTVKSKTMEGTLVYNNVLYRIIKLSKE